MRVDRPNLRVGLAIVCCALVAIPFLVVHFPPISDLPQHVAQVRLFLEYVGDPGATYRIQWLTPYSLVYFVIGAAWAAVGPEHAGRVAMILLGVLWTAAAHLVAARRGRPVEAAVLASALFFNSSTYWGFCSFLVGWPAFLYWTGLVAREPGERFRPRDAALTVGMSLVLYFSHALWFAAGLAWLGVSQVLVRPPLRVAAARFACAGPVAVLAAVWYVGFRPRFAAETVWDTAPWERFSPFWLADAVFGGIHGWIGIAALCGVGLWIAVGLWQKRRTLPETVDLPLVVCGLLLLAATFLLPYKYENTIQFSTRWAAPAVILLILGLPAPALAPRLVGAWAWGLLGVFSLSTALTWFAFERTELSGLASALEALPAERRVLGLDFDKHSPTIRGRPFLQTFAYAQVYRGGRLNFSFAEFAPMPVVFRGPQPHPWTPGLEWFAEEATPEDLQHFDFVVANGPDAILEFLANRPDLEPVTTEGRFRLYRVVPTR
jgi:hypothetical protein